MKRLEEWVANNPKKTIGFIILLAAFAEGIADGVAYLIFGV